MNVNVFSLYLTAPRREDAGSGGTAARNVDTDITRGISIRRGRRAAALLEELEKRVAAYQFDVALLSCGSYGLPLGHYITHHLGATAIYVGGALQLFFGLRGLRWRREIAPYASDAWACPERPKWDTSGMENYGLGPYWCPPAKNGS